MSDLWRSPVLRRCLQAALCLGAAAAAGLLAVETRVRQSSPTTPTPPQAVAGSTEATPPSLAETDPLARAKAHKALAEALARAAKGDQSGQVSVRLPIEASSADANAPADSDNEGLALRRPPLSAGDLQLLAAKAAQALKSGDIGGARLVLRRAASGGDATALFALAETYDPRVLARMHVRGVAGDVPRARDLYRTAQRLGVARAADRLDGLTRSAETVAN